MTYDVVLDHSVGNEPDEGYRTDTSQLRDWVIRMGSGEIVETPEYGVDIRGNDAQKLVSDGMNNDYELELNVIAENERQTSNKWGGTKTSYAPQGVHTERYSFDTLQWEGIWDLQSTDLPDSDKLFEYAKNAANITGPDDDLPDGYALQLAVYDDSNTPIMDKGSNRLATDRLHIDWPEEYGTIDGLKDAHREVSDLKQDVEQDGWLKTLWDRL